MNFNVRILLVLLSLFVLTNLLKTEASAEIKPPLIFGVVPQKTPSLLAQSWGPFIRALSNKSGIEIRFVTKKSIPAFEACLAAGAFDIAFMNPYHYTIFSESSGYSAFAHQKGKKLQGIIVVDKNSPIQNLESLEGLEIAFPSPAAFGASVIPRAEMKKRNVAISPKYVNSHDDAYRAVAEGHYIAGGGVINTLDRIPSEIRNQLKIIYKTEKYTPHAFAFHQRIPLNVQNEIKSAFVEIMRKDINRYKSIGMDGIEFADDKDWDQIRALGLRTSETEIQSNKEADCQIN